jgi:hypothetical protein
MEFKGFIRKVTHVPATGEKREHMRYSVVENWGRKGDPNQVSTWYHVRVYSLDELTRELLVPGSFVRVVGKLQPYVYEDGGTHKPGLDVLATGIEQVQFSASNPQS